MNSKLRQQLRRIYRRISGKVVGSSYDSVIRAEIKFYADYVKNGMTVFDVGANIGELTLLFSGLVSETGKVYSFEASSKVFGRLKALCEASGRENIYPNHLAVSNSEGILSLHVYEDQYSGLNSLADRPLEKYGISIKSIGTESVPSVTLDDFCLQYKIDTIDLLKIDVEGAEYQVLLGAKRLFQERRIKCCIFEFGGTTFDMGNHPNQIEIYFKECNYKLRNLMPREPNFPGRNSALDAQFSMHIATPKQ
jgi:FkbM family methyltransferase